LCTDAPIAVDNSPSHQEPYYGGDHGHHPTAFDALRLHRRTLGERPDPADRRAAATGTPNTPRLDVAWLRNESLEDTGNLPGPPPFPP